MPESDLHRTLKNVACRWLFACGYAAIAQEVEIPGVGIIDAAASGKWKRYNPRAVDYDRVPQVDRCHAVFVECKAFRSDFLRDQGRQNQFAFALAERKQSLRRRSTHRHLYASAALGKFDTCLMRPHAHMHYILTPPRLLKVEEVPRRWGWLVYEDNRVPQVDRCHAVFVECKAFRSDFLRDQGRQNQFAFALAERRQSLRRRSTRRHLHASAALGKFDTCLMRPHAHMHYILTPPRLLKVEEVPRRWGWLVYEDNRVRIVRRPYGRKSSTSRRWRGPSPAHSQHEWTLTAT